MGKSVRRFTFPWKRSATLFTQTLNFTDEACPVFNADRLHDTQSSCVKVFSIFLTWTRAHALPSQRTQGRPSGFVCVGSPQPVKKCFTLVQVSRYALRATFFNQNFKDRFDFLWEGPRFGSISFSSIHWCIQHARNRITLFIAHTRDSFSDVVFSYTRRKITRVWHVRISAKKNEVPFFSKGFGSFLSSFQKDPALREGSILSGYITCVNLEEERENRKLHLAIQLSHYFNFLRNSGI